MSPMTAKQAIGLEFDTGIVRVAELAGKVDNPKVLKLSSLPLFEGAVKEGIISEPEQVGKVLTELWQKAGLKDRKVVLGVSNQGVLVRHIKVPSVPLDKLKNIIHYQAQEYLPLPIESVVIDYLVLRELENAEKQEKELEILLVAARRDMLDIFLETLRLARLEPLDIDVSTMAMIGSLPIKAMDMTVAIVNIANGLNGILVSAKGKPHLARLGLVKISDLADSLRCRLEEIFDPFIVHQSGVDDIKSRWITALAGEIRSSLTYYNDQPNTSIVEGVLITGRGAQFEGIAASLEGYLGLPVRVFNPVKNITANSRKIFKDSNEMLEYTVSASLALRGLEG